MNIFRPWLRIPRLFGFGVAAAAALGVVGAGTLGFMWIESWTLLDAFYMTVITLSTVGYGEVQPLSTAGRLFGIALIGGGLATLGTAIGAMARWISEAPQHRNERRIRRMKEHIIICGYGRMGRRVADGLEQREKALCVIDASSQRIEEAARADIRGIEGDATAEETLERAGVRRASAIVAVLPHDGDNLSIAMTATALSPGIRVIARSEEERSRANLERAGAAPQDVISPQRTASQVVVRNLTSAENDGELPGIAELARRGFAVGELPVPAGSEWAGKTVAECSLGRERAPNRGVVVLALRRSEQETSFAPSSDLRVEAGDTLILMGEANDLGDLGARVEHLAPEPA